MSANELWTPTRVRNFMRELKMKATKWDENIVALAEKGSMSVEEFLKTDPITFGEKIWGKSKNVYIYHPTRKILGDSTYREMLYYYQNTPAQLAARAFMDAKVAAIKEQKALGLATYMGVSAEDKAGWECVFAENKAAKAAAQLGTVNEAEKAAGRAQDGWHTAALKDANARAEAKEADAALAALRQRAAAAAAAEKEWDERYYAEKRADEAAATKARDEAAKGAIEAAQKDARYAAAVEEDERYYAGRTHEQVVAEEEQKEALEIIRTNERNELLAKTEEDEAHEMWMIERMCGATSKWPFEESAYAPAPAPAHAPAPAPSIDTSSSSQVEVDEYLPEEQTQLVAGVKEEVEADAVPLLSTYDQSLREWSKASIYRTLRTDTDEEAIKKFEAFFMSTKSHKWGTPIEVAKMKVRLIDLLLNNFKDSHPSLLSFMYDRSPEDQQVSLEKGIRHFEAWKLMAEEQLRKLEAKKPFDFASFAKEVQTDEVVEVDESTQSDVSEVTDTQVSSCWACPTCTAVWRTG